MAAVTLVDCVREQWREAARCLMLDDPEIEAVELDGNNEEEKRYKSLQTWKRKFAFKKGLIEALLECGRSTVLRKYVCKLLAPQRCV